MELDSVSHTIKSNTSGREWSRPSSPTSVRSLWVSQSVSKDVLSTSVPSSNTKLSSFRRSTKSAEEHSSSNQAYILAYCDLLHRFSDPPRHVRAVQLPRAQLRHQGFDLCRRIACKYRSSGDMPPRLTTTPVRRRHQARWHRCPSRLFKCLYPNFRIFCKQQVSKRGKREKREKREKRGGDKEGGRKSNKRVLADIFLLW